MPKKPVVRDLYDYLAKFAPPTLAEEWDNVGLQVGSLKDPVNAVLVSLDLTEAVLWEAVENDANLIVTHHPIFLHPIRCLDDSSINTRLARLATQMEVNVLSFHTNLDSAYQGLNDRLAKILKLTSPRPLLPSRDPRHPKAGLGRIGKVKKSTLNSLFKPIAKGLKLKHLRYVGDPKHPIQKIAVVAGSGASLFREAKSAGADLLITGDIKYHQALDAAGEGLALIDIGHFAGEIGMVEIVAKKIRGWAKGKKLKLKVHETKAQEDPIQVFNF